MNTMKKTKSKGEDECSSTSSSDPTSAPPSSLPSRPPCPPWRPPPPGPPKRPTWWRDEVKVVEITPEEAEAAEGLVVSGPPKKPTWWRDEVEVAEITSKEAEEVVVVPGPPKWPTWWKGQAKKGGELVSAFKAFDSHCHLDRLFMEANRKNRKKSAAEEVWNKMLDKFIQERPGEFVNFDGCVAVFCHPKDFGDRDVVRLRHLRSHPQVHLALGVHPLKTDEADEWTLVQLRSAILELGEGAVALGECGLDFHQKVRRGGGRFKAPSEEHQVALFKKQLELAQELQKPLVLHIRDADKEAFDIMQKVSFIQWKRKVHEGRGWSKTTTLTK